METPMLDKMTSVQNSSQVIGEFIEWLEEKGYSIQSEVEYQNEHPIPFSDEVHIVKRKDWMPIRATIENLLAEYFEIDLNQVEQERRLLLEML